MSPTPLQCANAIRILSMDAVQKASSGHPGAPMGMADIATVLWTQFLNHSPQNPHWFNRDRFVLSNGHASMLLYTLLHLTGYNVTLADLQQFRQLGSKTPGHPEYGITPGVETTTGPLGQGLANAVGMALAEQLLADEYNRPNFPLIAHYTYVFMGDGCLMEGISHEVCSLAGTFKLGKLIAFWDNNGVSIDGPIAGWCQDNVPLRFQSYHWQVIEVDGHDMTAIQQAIQAAQANTTQPTLIACRTHIGYGSPNFAGSAKTHGAPLGDAECQAVREKLNWPQAPFQIDPAIYKAWDATETGAQKEAAWNTLLQQYQAAYPDLAASFLERLKGAVPPEWSHTLQEAITLWQNTFIKPMATRKASQQALNVIGPLLPNLIGGSADLSESNLTEWSGSKTLTPEKVSGNYVHYGVREFGMNAIMNGLALHGGFIPYGGTFLMFYDYGKNAVRLSALMKQRVIYVYTHDSIGLGEDGPTHQPIEHLANLRTIPNLHTWRPADAVETLVAWQQAIEYQGPSALCLTRQNVPLLSRHSEQLTFIALGAYVLKDYPSLSGVILATGSEVSLALQVSAILAADNIYLRVISCPCLERFSQAPQTYQDTVLPPDLTMRIAIEAAHPQSWYRWVGLQGKIFGLETFGESAPGAAVFEHVGFTVERLVSDIRRKNESCH